MCDDVTIERASAEYKNLSQVFSDQTRDYTKQYCSIYLIRLEQMRNILSERIAEKWGDDYPIVRLHKLSEVEYDKCVVVGTLFKDQKLKPSVLKQLSEANQLVPQPILSHFADTSDVLFIEDELQRYQLEGQLDGQKLVTGVSCALLGRDSGKGKFEVLDCLFAGYRNQIERPFMEDPLFVLLISGLDIVNAEKSMLNLQILTNWISGLIELSDEIPSKNIVRLIIAGNSVRTSAERAKPSISMTSRIVEAPASIEAVKLFDLLLYGLCELIDVDVMPGENDPSNHILPQKQMHHCMFPKSACFKSLNQVPNPYRCSVGGVDFLGSSGQTVRDVLRFSEVKEATEALELCLRWGHMAPTAPDTLGCFPFYVRDPFILEDCPHVFFAGNQEKFDTKMTAGENDQIVRLISIPEFATTHEVCLLNLKNLDCFPVAITVDL